MIQYEPLTPPVKLVEQWIARSGGKFDLIAQWAARWGADQELGACCESLYQQELAAMRDETIDFTVAKNVSEQLRNVRRPKPPSLKQQVIEVIEQEAHVLQPASISILRQALATLP